MRGRGDPTGDPNHTQAMHYRWNQRGVGHLPGDTGVRGQRVRMQKNGTMWSRTKGEDWIG